MDAIETTVTETEETQAKRVAKEFNRLLRGGGNAYAYLLDGSWYVVTSGTGEGGDFAYDPSEIDGSFAEHVDAETGKFDYSEWCAAGTRVVDDLSVAVAYYMQGEGVLMHGGSCSYLLSDEQIAALKIAKGL